MKISLLSANGESVWGGMYSVGQAIASTHKSLIVNRLQLMHTWYSPSQTIHWRYSRQLCNDNIHKMLQSRLCCCPSSVAGLCHSPLVPDRAEQPPNMDSFCGETVHGVTITPTTLTISHWEKPSVNYNTSKHCGPKSITFRNELRPEGYTRTVLQCATGEWEAFHT